MKKILILAAVAAAVTAIVAVKLAKSSSDAPSSCCPCTLAKQAVTNELDEASSNVE